MLKIRTAANTDAESISRLVLQGAEEFIVSEFSDSGGSFFLADHSVAEVSARLAGAFRFYVAERHGELAGVAAVRLPHHLYYLFVAGPQHRTGVARSLWSYVLADPAFLDQRLFTVNASNYAVPAYERFGFRRCGAQREEHGVLFNPMEYRRDG